VIVCCTEPDEAIRRLQHEKNVWRAIAIGLASVLLLMIVVGIALTLFSLRQARAERQRAEDAMQNALEQRQQVERAGMEADEARKAAEKQKAKP